MGSRQGQVYGFSCQLLHSVPKYNHFMSANMSWHALLLSPLFLSLSLSVCMHCIISLPRVTPTPPPSNKQRSISYRILLNRVCFGVTLFCILLVGNDALTELESHSIVVLHFHICQLSTSYKQTLIIIFCEHEKGRSKIIILTFKMIDML